MTTLHTSQSNPRLPSVHRYASYVSRHLCYSRMYRDLAWRESVGLTVPVSRFQVALICVGVPVACLFFLWACCADGAIVLSHLIF